MKKYLEEFRVVNKPERLIKILLNWKLWIVGAIVGALIGAGLYAFFPPKYRAQAVVIVDQNIEQAFQYVEDRELFTFMHRETNKLEKVAWSDDVLQLVEDGFGEVQQSKLKSSILGLTFGQDGAWYFYADHDDGETAQLIANLWVEAFIEKSMDAVEVSAELEIARDNLEDFLAENPDALRVEVDPYLGEIIMLQESVKGVSQYIDMALLESAAVPAERSIGQGTYILLMAVLIEMLLFLTLLFLPQDNKREND